MAISIDIKQNNLVVTRLAIHGAQFDGLPIWYIYQDNKQVRIVILLAM